MNEHFSIELWTDFARGLDVGGRRNAMQVHLDQGCAQCRQRVQVLESAWQASRLEAVSEPPEQVLARARAIFPSAPQRPASDWIGLVAELLFDSWTAPAAAGVRSGRIAARQLKYKAGAVEVELHVENPSGSRTLQIVGQIVTAGAQNPAGQSWVHLHAGDHSQSAECNEFGEFQIESRIAPGVRLRIDLAGRGETLELKLPD